MTDVLLDGAQIVATGTHGATAPPAGTVQRWEVARLDPVFGSGLTLGQTYALVDVSPGVLAAQAAEIIRVLQCSGAGATRVSVQRGADGTTPVAHNPMSTYRVALVSSALSIDLAGAQPLMTVGVLAARPSAVTAGANATYFATDVAGGTLYRSDGATWAALAAGVNAAAGVELAYQEITALFSTTNTTPTDVTGLTGITFTAPASGKVNIIGHGEIYNTTANDGAIITVTDGTTEYCRARNSGGPANLIEDAHAQQRWVLTPGNQYTIKMTLQATGGGTANIVDNSTAPHQAAYVQVLSC